VRFEIKVKSNNTLEVAEIYSVYPGEVIEKKYHDITLNTPFTTSLGTIQFITGESRHEIQPGDDYILSVLTVESAVDKMKENLTVEAINKDASAIQITHNGPLIPLNNAIINTIINKHEELAIEDKNEVTESTSEFIKERMILIEMELSSVEDSSQAFKFKNRLIDVESDAANYLSKEGALEKSITESNIQLSLAEFMNEFIQKAKGYDELLPANLGFEDASISALTAEHNKLVLERNRLLQSSSAKNPMVANIDGQITAIRASLKESLSKLKQSLELQINILKKQEAIYKGKLSNVPEFEREYREILRQQQIKETLYLYLLQKREENQIAMASTMGSVKVLDYAYSSREPVAPKKKIIFLGAILLGLILPVGVIYVRDLLNTKVTKKEEIEKLGIPLIGQVPQNPTKDYLVAIKGKRNSVSEAFRILRTNMSFLLNAENTAGKVIFSTSTIAGEGKTFLALNLANTLAMTSKSVVLIGLDLRAPKIGAYLGEPKDTGVSDYIVDESMPINKILHSKRGDIYFDFLLSGTIPPNPSELLMSNRLKDLISYCKINYDYVIIDSAPVGLVVDTVSIVEYADLVLYTIRANHLDKHALDIPVNLYNTKTVRKMGLVFNGVSMKSGTYGAYGYGYGYGDNKKKSFWKRLF
jgi:capsular exopolysaccharide synthesis family protein